MAKKTKEEPKTIEKKVRKATTTKKKTSNPKTKSTTTNKKKTSSTIKNETTNKNLRTIKKVSSNTTLRKVDRLIKNYEYYDLPHRYNQTTVKILAQTPSKLFVYWDISDKDNEEFIKKYGSNFHNETNLVLLVYNYTKEYYFKIIVDDFANSWYISIPDDNCRYKVKLAREYKNNENNYIQIAESNHLKIPNGKVLNKSIKKAKFKNVKTNAVIEKEIVSNIYNKISDDIFSINNPSSNFI